MANGWDAPRLLFYAACILAALVIGLAAKAASDRGKRRYRPLVGKAAARARTVDSRPLRPIDEATLTVWERAQAASTAEILAAFRIPPEMLQAPPMTAERVQAIWRADVRPRLGKIVEDSSPDAECRAAIDEF